MVSWSAARVPRCRSAKLLSGRLLSGRLLSGRLLAGKLLSDAVEMVVDMGSSGAVGGRGQVVHPHCPVT
jgi:hypothetical protein